MPLFKISRQYSESVEDGNVRKLYTFGGEGYPTGLFPNDGREPTEAIGPPEVVGFVTAPEGSVVAASAGGEMLLYCPDFPPYTAAELSEGRFDHDGPATYYPVSDWTSDRLSLALDLAKALEQASIAYQWIIMDHPKLDPHCDLPPQLAHMRELLNEAERILRKN
jgi:hypothetical protein